MLHTLSVYSAKNICQKVPEHQFNLSAYIYGFSLLYSSIFTSILLLIISALMSTPFHLFAFMLFFIPVRTTAGGYHCNTYLKCTIVSCLCYVLTVLISLLLIWLPVIPALMLTGFLVCYIYRNSPVKNKKNPLSPEVYQKNKVKTKWILLIYTLMILLLHFTTFRFMATMGIATLITVAVLIYITKNKKKES